MSDLRRWAALVLGLAACACSDSEAEPRDQWLVIVDTNAPVVGQLTAEPSWSDAAVDTLRIDLEGQDPFQIVAPDARDWPITFGVLPGSEPPTLRLRAFRSGWAEPSSEGPVLTPDRATTIDRVVQLTSPPGGVTRVRVTLDLACVGVLPAFGNQPQTCVDADRPSAFPNDGIERVGDGAVGTVVGTWAGLGPVDCRAVPVPERVCIVGGYSVLGAPELAGQLSEKAAAPPFPRRPVRVSPFWLDRTEMTVGRFRKRALEVQGPLPRQRGSGLDQHCTWLGPDDGANDDLPLNCVQPTTAAEVCSLFGGRLPTEAEWEHAARGSGRGHRYPWGNQPPSCCATSVSRGSYCPGSGPEKIGSHPPEACDGIGDLSQAGVIDLAGSVAEYVSGDFLPYDADCWRKDPIPLDPTCTHGSLSVPGTRGGDFASGFVVTAAPLRVTGQVVSPWEGFRCVYEDRP